MNMLSEIGFRITEASVCLGFVVFVCWFMMPMDPRPYYRGRALFGLTFALGGLVWGRSR